VNEVAEVLKVRPGRVRELIKSGKLKAEHHPTSYVWMVSKRSVTSYMKKPMKGCGRRRKVDGQW